MGMATKSFNSKPTTKTGAARKMKLVTVATRSADLFCRRAA